MQQTSLKVHMAVFRERLVAGELACGATDRSPEHETIYVVSGAIQVGSSKYADGDGLYLPRSGDCSVLSDGADILRFVCVCNGATAHELDVSRLGTRESTLVLKQSYTSHEAHAVLRLDRVDFPPGAVAYRHTHPGGGLRYLTTGSLQLDAEAGMHEYTAGEAWFEDANSPVLATANATQKSQFIRMMLIPASFEGKSTFTHLNEADIARPRLQTNLRFFDRPVSLGA